METWFKKQNFYEESRLSKIKHWMSSEVIDLVAYQLESKNISLVMQ